MSSLVQRQSERQGIFLIALSLSKEEPEGSNISLILSLSALFLAYSVSSSLSYSGLTGVSR